MCFELQQKKPNCTSKAIPLVTGRLQGGTKNLKKKLKYFLKTIRKYKERQVKDKTLYKNTRISSQNFWLLVINILLLCRKF